MSLFILDVTTFSKCIDAPWPVVCSFLFDHNPLSISARGSVSDFPFAIDRFYLVKLLAASEKVSILRITDIIMSHKITLVDEIFHKWSPALAVKLLTVKLYYFIIDVNVIRILCTNNLIGESRGHALKIIIL